MRASADGSHVSGAERIVREGEIDAVMGELVKRALSAGQGKPDSVTVTLDSLTGREIVHLSPLPISTVACPSVSESHERAAEELVRVGVSEQVAMAALLAITAGASPDGGNMRGAMVVDAATGRRIEPDMARGVRARAVDYDEGFRSVFAAELNLKGLVHPRVMEAVAVATKVANAPGCMAELCISDDPAYLTGYVASKVNGYVRITPMKAPGDSFGGRAFFVDRASFDHSEFYRYMRETPVLITSAIKHSNIAD